MGRAWSSAGGTLSLDGESPGPFYVLASGAMDQVGSGGRKAPDIETRAVWYGTRAIQRALNRRLGGRDVRADGKFGPRTHAAVVRYQRRHGLDDDGAVGRVTARALFEPLTKRLETRQVKACLLNGKISNESGWDPGAVGFADDDDLGLNQINGRAHPDMSEDERFSPLLSIDYAVGLIEANLNALDDNLRDAVAAYNLGVGGWSSRHERLVGAKGWIADGRPDEWTPPGQDSPRNVKGYIDRILSECP
jgi:Transglycosylase SLT domain/Putative peptidoglycan binding domain